jgi:hypothetical protein
MVAEMPQPHDFVARTLPSLNRGLFRELHRVTHIERDNEMGKGRPLIGDRPMTAAERQRRSRALRKAARVALKDEGSTAETRITPDPTSQLDGEMHQGP